MLEKALKLANQKAVVAENGKSQVGPSDDRVCNHGQAPQLTYAAGGAIGCFPRSMAEKGYGLGVLLESRQPFSHSEGWANVQSDLAGGHP